MLGLRSEMQEQGAALAERHDAAAVEQESALVSLRDGHRAAHAATVAEWEAKLVAKEAALHEDCATELDEARREQRAAEESLAEARQQASDAAKRSGAAVVAAQKADAAATEATARSVECQIEFAQLKSSAVSVQN